MVPAVFRCSMQMYHDLLHCFLFAYLQTGGKCHKLFLNRRCQRTENHKAVCDSGLGEGDFPRRVSTLNYHKILVMRQLG